MGIPRAAVCQLNDIVVDVLTGLNGGTWPTTVEEYENIAGRMGLKITRLDPGICGEPHIRYDHALNRGRLYVADRRTEQDSMRVLFHELAELALCTDGAAEPMNYPAEWGSVHEIAHRIEELHFGRR